MRFLIEKSILTPEQEDQFEDMNNYNKRKFMTNFVRNHPNYSNLKSAESLYVASLLDDGVEDSTNKFIIFMNKINTKLPYEVVALVKQLIDTDKLDPTKRYLYNKSLYTEDTKSILTKIKALTYASNNSLQSGASREITPESLMDKSGKFLGINDIQKILNNIKITSSSDMTIKNAINKLYGYKNLSNQNNINQLKNKFKKLIQQHKSFKEEMLEIIDKAPIDALINIPITNTTDKGIQIGLINYLTGKTKIIPQNKKRPNINIPKISSKLNKSEKEVSSIIDKSIEEVDDSSSIIKEEALSILTNLGVGKTAAKEAIDKIYTKGMSLEEIINTYFRG